MTPVTVAWPAITPVTAAGFVNIGGQGTLTTLNGIEVITVDGSSDGPSRGKVYGPGQALQDNENDRHCRAFAEIPLLTVNKTSGRDNSDSAITAFLCPAATGI